MAVFSKIDKFIDLIKAVTKADNLADAPRVLRTQKIDMPLDYSNASETLKRPMRTIVNDANRPEWMSLTKEQKLDHMVDNIERLQDIRKARGLEPTDNHAWLSYYKAQQDPLSLAPSRPLSSDLPSTTSQFGELTPTVDTKDLMKFNDEFGLPRDMQKTHYINANGDVRPIPQTYKDLIDEDDFVTTFGKEGVDYGSFADDVPSVKLGQVYDSTSPRLADEINYDDVTDWTLFRDLYGK